MGKLIRFFVAPLLLAFGIAQFSPLVLAQAVEGEAPDDTSNQGSDSSGLAMGTASDSVAEAEETTEYVGEMYQIGLGWHPAALDGLPTDKFGLVDWVKALEQGLINPRANVDPKVPDGIPFDMNIVMPSKTGMISGAYFPHKTHTTWMSCDSCHTKIFMPLAGSNDLTMSTIVKGQACGVCHGKVAFPLNDCTRCHLSPDSEVAAGGSGQ
jgi:c(7)-type cytochrome triheme protein